MNQKLYNSKSPSHPDDAHTQARRWFKQKGRKRVRKELKDKLKGEEE